MITELIPILILSWILFIVLSTCLRMEVFQNTLVVTVTL